MKKLLSFRSSSALARLIARLKADRRGGVMMLTGLAIIPLTFVVGFGVDYARAMRLQTHLNAAADAAALMAVSPAMILKSDEEAKQAAYAIFDKQADLQNGYQGMQRTATITSGANNTALGYLRKASVTYTVQSTNLFGGLLGAPTLTVHGTSTASAAQPPNVDFYLAMDNSPSMLLPATSDGITKIINATKSPSLTNGCAFACHAQMPKTDSIYVRDTSSRHILLSLSYYTSGSSNQNVFYRWDSVANAVYDSAGNPMNSTSSVVSPTTRTNSGSGCTGQYVDKTTTTTTVTTYTVTDSTTGPATINKSVVVTPTNHFVYTNMCSGATSINNNTGTVTTTNSTYDTGYWADGYWLTHNYGQIYGTPLSLSLRKDEVVAAATQLIPFAANQASQYHVTYQAQMFSFDWTKSGNSTPVNTLNSLTNVASYGSGFSAASLFPADDYWWKNSQPTSSTNINDRASEFGNMLTKMNAVIPTAGTGAPGVTPQKILFIISDGMLDQPNGSGRYFGPLTNTELATCTAIKAKGIKIAVLYTQYLPESLAGDSWSQSNVAPFLPAPPSPYSATNAGSSDQVLTKLQSCASPGSDGSPLVQTVTTNDNITTALQQLFSTALQSARLVQ